MAVAKSNIAFVSSISNAAGASKTSGWIDVSDAYSVTVWTKSVNGTAPTIGVSHVVSWASDTVGLHGSELNRIVATVTASTTAENTWDIPPEAQAVKVDFVGNTGQAVTVESYGAKITG